MKRLFLGGTALLVLAAILLLWLASHTGRTPAELIRYTERRLEGHPRLEALALPVLDQLKTYWSGDDALLARLPFQVPPLPPNPAYRPGAADVLPLAPANSAARVIQVGPMRAVTRIADAARLARDGDTIEIDPGDYRADVAVWDRAQLTIRGMGQRVRLIAAGASAEGKAIWVIRRGQVLIEGIDFIGARVEDRNGGGIRHESGQLTVRRCLFYGNETGILTGGGPQTTLLVEQSEFAYNGHGDGLSHHIYAGDMGLLTVTGSYFHHANVGHLIKSRAARHHIAYNRLTDESGGRASYELEFPDGGVAEVVGNLVQQGTQTRNSVMVSYGAEGLRWPDNALTLVHNTLVNDHPDGGTFVHVHPAAVRVLSRNNLHAGPGRWIVAKPAVDAAGDVEVGWPAFVLPAREDYRLSARGREKLAHAALAQVDAELLPRQEYHHPMRLQPLLKLPVYPGALQSPGP